MDILERLHLRQQECPLDTVFRDAIAEIERLQRMCSAFANPDHIFECPPAPQSIDPTGW